MSQMRSGELWDPTVALVKQKKAKLIDSLNI